MKVLVNRKTKKLFILVLLSIMVFFLISIAVIALKVENTILYILLCFLGMSILILTIGYRYFKEQNIIMENAIIQIKEYISGNQNAYIECNDEGELYRLFHEVNSLVSILNAHVENEGKTKEFLKDTISDISHQLKTPLTALNIYNGIIAEEADRLSTIEEFTALSEKELDRIEILVKNLLKVAKFDAGTIVMEKYTENISEMMNSIEKYFNYRSKEEEKRFYLSGDDNITLLCDRSWIIEAVSNIVKNAFDHTEKGNNIYIEWEKFATLVQIIVKDDGIGIYPEDLYHIFKRFYRSRFSKDKNGIGLGLPLAKAIIEAHKGSIEVDSHLGKGTVFTISFLIPTEL